MASHMWSVVEAKSDHAVADPSPTIGYAAALSCWLLSAGVYVAAKWAIAEMPPWTLCFWRVTIAALVLAPFVLRHGPAIHALLRERWREVLIIGGLGLAITQGLMYVGLQYTSAINAGLILALMPIFTMVLARFLLDEALGVWQAVGSAVALAGMVVIIVRGDFAALLRLDFNLGEMWIVVAALCFGVYTVLLKRAKFALPRLPLLVILLAAAALVALPFHLWDIFRGAHESLDTRGFLALAYAAIPGGALMYLLYNWSVEALGASKAGAFMYSQMIFVAALAYLLLGEPIERFHWAGGALIVAGVVLVMAFKPASPPVSPSLKADA
jgi:drug/metabolite transporter (DMT)-like permease